MVVGAFRRHLAPDEVAGFEKVWVRWEALRPAGDAGAEADLALTRALVRVRVGYNLLTRDRRLGWHQIAGAMRACPAVRSRIPWLRVAALLVLGDHARRLTGRAAGP